MKKLSIILLASVFLAGCSKNFFDINTSPNASSNASVELVLANTLKSTADGQITNFTFLGGWMGYWVASGSYAISATDVASYKQTTNFADNNGLWSNNYDILEDLDYIEKTATANSNYFYIGTAKVMKAYIFGQLVDMFGNVPYTQAFKSTANLLPVYDDAKAIYEDLAKQLDASVVFFQRADAVGSASQDVLFGGDNAKWAQFANSLKLRLLLRQTQIAGRSGYIQTEINKIVANGSGFLSTEALVNPGYSNSTGKQNPFWGFCINTAGTYTQDYWRAAKYPITFCQANNDPRYTAWYAPIAAGGYVGGVLGGNPNGTPNPVGSAMSVFGPGLLKSVAQGAPIMTAAESYFLQTEAVARGFLSGNAGNLFNSGVQASFTYLNSGSASSYTSQAGNKQTNYNACTNLTEQLACIMRQKWEACNTTTPIEAWSDYRRLGLPADIPLSNSTLIDQSPAKIPFRILYPTIEYNTNAANVGAQGSIDYHSTKIFWMP